MKLEFTAPDAKLFAKASEDYNPLHVDRAYSQKTQFGEPVCHGIAVILKMLGIAMQNRPLHITHLTAKFTKAVHRHKVYQLEVHEESSKISILLGKGGKKYISLKLEVEERQSACSDDWKSDIKFEGKVLSLDFLKIQKFAETADLNLQCLPSSQFLFLLWSSFYVGMIKPGEQALYSSLAVDFQNGDNVALDLEIEETSLDQRFNLWTIQGGAKDYLSFQIKAYERPKQVKYDIEDLIKRFGESCLSHDQNIFITGATRGFGSLIARTYALRGARVWSTKRDSSGGDNSGDEISDIKYFNGDLGEPFTLENVKNCFVEQKIELDFLYLNAFPVINQVFFEEMSHEEFVTYVQKAISLSINTLYYLLPLVKAEGSVIHISSEFCLTYPKGFSHYVTSKMALEGLMNSLQSEFPKVHFFNFRARKMLTDQTSFQTGAGALPVSAIDELERLFENIK